jgi:DNA-binding MarR family transcriptional regulator
VAITASGRELAAEVLRCADEVAERLVLARLPETDVRALRRVLAKLTRY